MLDIDSPPYLPLFPCLFVMFALYATRTCKSKPNSVGDSYFQNVANSNYKRTSDWAISIIY